MQRVHTFNTFYK